MVAAYVIGSLIASTGMAAQSPTSAPVDVRGEWAGDYDTTIGVFPNTFSLTSEDFTTGAFGGTGNGGADTIVGTVSGSEIRFTSSRPGYSASSVGTVSADGSTITGGMASDTNGRTGTFLLRRTSGPPGASAAPVAAPGASAAPVGGPAPPSEPGGGVAVQPGTQPPKLEYVLPSPFEISLAPQDVFRSIGIVTFVMLLIGAPTPIFNSTLSANRALIERWARRRRPKWLREKIQAWSSGSGASSKISAERIATLSHTWSGLALYLGLAGLVYAFLDSAFPFSDGGRILFTTLVGIAIGTAVSQLPGEWYVRKHYASRGTVDVALWTIALAAACVVITRVTGFQPGYVYGIIGGFTFSVALTKDDKGRMAFRGMALLLAVGVAAWFARIPFQPLNGAVGSDPNSLVNHVLAGVFTSAVQGAAIALIPLRFLAGDRIRDSNRLRWLVLWGISIALFAHVLLYPVSSFTPNPSESGLWTLIAVVIVYTAIALGFWWFFQRRATRREFRRARAASSQRSTGEAGPESPAS